MFYRKKKCKHNPKKLNNSLKKLDKKTMVYPPVEEYICTVCHQFFEFKKL